MPDGSVEFMMRCKFAAIFFDKRISEFYRVAFDDDIEVLNWLAQQKVTHYSPNKIAGHVHRCGLGGDVCEESLLIGRKQVWITQEARQVLLHKINFTLIIAAMKLIPNPSPRMWKSTRSG